MDIRKSVFDLNANEKGKLIKAFLLLKSDIVNPLSPKEKQFSVYDQFVALHGVVMGIEKQGWTNRINFAHNGLAFLPWHRVYIRHFEMALQSKVAGVTLPYWDWTDIGKTRSELFSSSFASPLSDINGLNYITDGYFVPNYSGEKPDWWDENIIGYEINTLLDGYSTNNPNGYLIRSQGIVDDPWPMSEDEIKEIINIETAGFHSYFAFRSRLESGGTAHNSGHRWIGGHMATGYSPNDPVFWFHHTQVDRLWSLWQKNVGAGTNYPSSNIDSSGNEIPPGHKLHDRMWPWVGDENHLYKPVSEPNSHHMLPTYTPDEVHRPIDVLDHENLKFGLTGYNYK